METEPLGFVVMVGSFVCDLNELFRCVTIWRGDVSQFVCQTIECGDAVLD